MAEHRKYRYVNLMGNVRDGQSSSQRGGFSGEVRWGCSQPVVLEKLRGH